MKVRIETADLLVVTRKQKIVNRGKRHYERKSVRVGIHPDNKDFGTQVQECNSALDNTVYYWFSESEFAEVQKHLDLWKLVFLLEGTTEEDTLILDVSDNNEPFEIKEKDNETP
tara:strand:- start:1930 stop:2271 length:342 start_codon:yes stop_codon:yes gene_type:complete